MNELSSLAKQAFIQQKNKLFISLLCFHLLVLFISFAFKGLSLALFLSFELSFFGAFFIFLSSYLNYKKLILRELESLNISPKPLCIWYKKAPKKLVFVKFLDANADLKPRFKNFLWFFSALKMLVYIVFVLIFLFLQKNGYLSIFGLFAGIFALLIGILCFGVVIRKK
ncbi:hypothetical protein CQA38_05500 [Campylobacter sp. MIT 12-5580]|uniref:hypothetical protein n=1 Tax=Campylobacter sp. MIT 12-5580 TaxID=2040651 RepID=UPI0010F5888E|nr:hypothetical protein [Campylobacter sp. MIT 12-5580]TKX29021.1 hypothetical protein CQA38_05500 [Campylobacter sp. MIT 12-5580]